MNQQNPHPNQQQQQRSNPTPAQQQRGGPYNWNQNEQKLIQQQGGGQKPGERHQLDQDQPGPQSGQNR